MKDSQRPVRPEAGNYKYIKANNERFSTSPSPLTSTAKYIKANNERFSTLRPVVDEDW